MGLETAGRSYLRQSEVHPGDKAWNRTGDKLDATPVRGSSRLRGWRHDQGEAIYNIGLRSIQEARLGTSYLQRRPEVHPGDKAGDELPAPWVQGPSRRQG